MAREAPAGEAVRRPDHQRRQRQLRRAACTSSFRSRRRSRSSRPSASARSCRPGPRRRARPAARAEPASPEARAGRGRLMADRRTSRPTRPGGRAIRRATPRSCRPTLEVFVEEGYAGVSIEGVAARAGVGKATIYRRYSSKAELVVEAGPRRRLHRRRPAARHRRPAGRPPAHDAAADRSPAWRATARCSSRSWASGLRHPELAAEFDRSVIGPQDARHTSGSCTAVGRRRAARDADVELIAESPAAIVDHAVNNLPIDGGYAAQVIDHVIRTASPPAATT